MQVMQKDFGRFYSQTELDLESHIYTVSKPKCCFFPA